MRSFRLGDWLMAALLLAFAGSSVTFLEAAFNVTTRWAILALVGIYLLFKAQFFAPFRTAVGTFALAWFFWALATSWWSEVPELSLLKSFVFLEITFCGIGLGQLWARHRPARQSLGYIYPLMAVTVAAGLAGQFSGGATVQAGDANLFQGAVTGPNMFGTLVAMCSPLVLWHLYANWNDPRRRWISVPVAGLMLYYLIASGSRAAMLAVVCVILGLVMTLRISRRMQLTALFVGVCTAAFLLAPSEMQDLARRLVYKQVEEDSGVFYSREEVWQDTWAAAQEGGWFGAGYGVSVGDTSYTIGVTTVGYGREKGNSQLAIVEETGIVGLLIYAGFLIALLRRLISRLRLLPPGPDKVLLGIIAGTLIGFTVQSGFEAWWCSPGSPESVYFWTLCGVALAMGVSRQKMAVERDAIAPNEGRGIWTP